MQLEPLSCQYVDFYRYYSIQVFLIFYLYFSLCIHNKWIIDDTSRTYRLDVIRIQSKRYGGLETTITFQMGLFTKFLHRFIYIFYNNFFFCIYIYWNIANDVLLTGVYSKKKKYKYKSHVF